MATSVTTSVCTKLPFGTGPLCATRSASAKPGGGSSQSENVRTGMLARTGDGALRRRFLPARSRTPRSERSIVAGLIARSPARMSGPSCRWPCLSMAATKVGISAFSRLPQIRSDASPRTTSASRTASSWMRRPPRPSVPLAVDPDRRTRIACFRWKPVTASNSSRIRLFSIRSANRVSSCQRVDQFRPRRRAHLPHSHAPPGLWFLGEHFR